VSKGVSVRPRKVALERTAPAWISAGVEQGGPGEPEPAVEAIGTRSQVSGRGAPMERTWTDRGGSWSRAISSSSVVLGLAEHDHQPLSRQIRHTVRSQTS
jgi:hypothetical protein